MQARCWRAPALSLLSVCLAAGSCGKSAAPPAGFGVNLTIALDAAIRPSVKGVTVHVTGAEQYDKPLAMSVFSAGEARIHYVPHVQSGTLTFTVEAFDGGQALLGIGMSTPVALVAARAVATTVDVHATIGGMTGDASADAPTDAAADAPVDAPTRDASPSDAPTTDAGATDARDAATDTGTRGKKGDPCATTQACQTGLTCTDGVCCDGACGDSCSACNLAGREGTCSPIPAGMMPAAGHPTCAVDAPATCRKDGTCDGQGACRLYPVGTVCRASTCDKSTDAFTPEFKCDGAGFCQTNVAIMCAPFKCKDTSVCYATCTDNTQCTANKTCTNGSCGLKSAGATCTNGQECASSFCADGVCCDKACQAGCESCNLPTTRGTCSNVPAGQDPKGICPAGTAENAVCSPGGCQGTGGAVCRKADTSVVCRAASCANGTATNPATCQASGVCPTIAQTACGLYTCGATSCNTRCTADGQCIGGHYCASNGTCQAQKTAGTACAATAECQSGLTCTDGVCCTTPACPSCRNCGATGTCSVVVAGAEDTSGTTCSGTRSCNGSGTCLLVNGQSCGSSGSSCVSGNCLDGVCCSVASCGSCRNCGSHGTCEVTVTNADDTSGQICAADQSCDGTATCKTRWALVGKVTAGEAPRPYFSAGVGNYLYFANANNEGAMVQYFKSFNVTTSTFADEALTANPFCDCGFEGTLVGQPLNGRIYYAANTSDDKSYVAGGSWTTFPGGYPAPRGEASTAVLGRRIYWVGGRGGLSSVQAYDTTSDTWITSGIAPTPVGIDSGCAGANAGVVYVFGGRVTSSTMMAYTEASNSWATLNVAPPAGCYGINLPTWRGKLVMADNNGMRAFTTSTQSWDPPVPVPSTASNWVTMVAGSANDLYLLGWAQSAIYIYKWVFN